MTRPRKTDKSRPGEENHADAPLARVPFVSPPTRWHNGRFDVAMGVVPLSWIAPASYNPRTMSAEQRKRLERGLETFGLVDTIVVCEDGHLLGGHQRLISEAQRGATEVPVYVVIGLTAGQRAAVNVLLNNPNAQGEWDMTKLSALLSDLDAHGVDATITGFDDKQLASILTFSPPAGSDLDGPELGAVEYQLVVTCADEHAQGALCAELEARGLTCRPLML